METLFVGRNLIFLPEVDSTNSYAINLLKNVNISIAEGSVVHTAQQTNGKGQRGNVWNAEPASNLTASVILNPVFLELKDQFFLYKVTALACYDVMAELLNSSQFDIKIKWPNDILVNKKKIAGVLIENIISNGRLSRSVIGVGINTNQTNFDESLRATSLKLLSEKNYEVSEVLKLFCTHLEKYYLQLKNNKTQLINDLYLKRFFKLDQWQDFEIDNKIRSLLIVGISEFGLLLLEDNKGKQMEFDLKSLRWLI